ncbi:Signal transduction histidine kinase [Seinonella peptonophila]|uniref:Heme sensor protein HssS n=1 Tax=Seinonella peptonophila TaxID=112248 RepID=A0A1M4XNN7_9BACL|nr:HAMP domain-containing sensor histidine kinase [Seinonella peptonophila]SHE94883.1 Signal transduction histidine kinase [Seinonella peptonophila]
MKRDVKELGKRTIGLIGLLLALSLLWALSFKITAYIYDLFAIQPHELVRQLINSLLGFFLFFFVIYLISRLGLDRQKDRLDLFVNAIRQIAQGNFHIQLPKTKNHMFIKLVESINDMAQRLGHMETMRQEFISNVSHEIQSPLTSIRGFARELKEGNLPPQEQKRYLEIIEIESKRLSNISENLLKLTSLESAEPPFEPNRYRLDQQIQSVILICEPQWLAKQLDINISLPKTVITADETLMSQVWMNLIHNSIKFTPNNGTIHISIESNVDSIQVIIQDSGIGMSREDQFHIFERFYKADRSRNRKTAGSGLGLSIVKKIIELHQGKIEVQSQLKQGSTFVVTLPYNNKSHPNLEKLSSK